MCTRICMYILAFYNFLSFSEAAGGFEEIEDPCGALKATVSEEDECYVRGVPVTCQNNFTPYTKIVKRCRSPYNANGQENVTYVCEEFSEWKPSYDPCLSDCGQTTLNNRYPWIAGLYNISDERLICTGAIISPYHIVTVAQCIQNDIIRKNNTISVDHTKFKVIAGNINLKNSSQQNRTVKGIVIHEDFSKFMTTSGKDILLIEVDKEFEFLDDVRPACIDWHSFYEDEDFKNGNEGIVVGLGYDKDEVVPCEAATVRYWQKNTCWKNLPEDFRKMYFGNDKFCAQYINDTTCGKDIGTGLLFKSNRQKFFLRGITSITNITTESYALYTRISNYLEWLKGHMSQNKRISPFHFETFEEDVYTGSCILPKHIQSGKFTLITSSTYSEGSQVPSQTAILLSCDDTNRPMSSFRCLDTEWSPSIDETACKKPDLSAVEVIVNTGGCILPKHLQSGNFNLATGSRYSEGSQVPLQTVILLSCDDTNAPMSSFRCLDSRWSPSIDETACKKPDLNVVERNVNTGGCILPKHLQSGKFNLVTGNTYSEDAQVPSQTVILLSCDGTNTHMPSFRCLDSRWTPLIDETACKRPDLNAVEVIVNTGSCILPKHLQSGKFNLVTGSMYSEGTPVPPQTVILLSCDDTNTHMPSFRCLDSRWRPLIDETACKKPDLNVGEANVYTGGCILPKHLRSGKFNLVTGNRYSEGIQVPSQTVILLSCDDTNTHMPSFRCLDSRWRPSIDEAACKKPDLNIVEPNIYTGGCILPKHLQYGKFNLVAGNTYSEGTQVPAQTIILLSCDDPNTHMPYFRCLDSRWSPSIDETACKKSITVLTSEQTSSNPKIWISINVSGL